MAFGGRRAAAAMDSAAYANGPRGELSAARARGERELSRFESIGKRTREDVRVRAHERTRAIERSLRSLIAQARRHLSHEAYLRTPRCPIGTVTRALAPNTNLQALVIR